MTKVYLIRHPEAIGNRDRIFQGSSDLDVTEKGQKQLECLTKRFKNIPIDVIYSSPQIRAYKTALAVKGTHNINIIKMDDLRELDGGVFEGKAWQTLDEEFKDEMFLWNTKPHLFKAEGGESMEHVFNRVTSALNKIIRENDGKTVVITSHGCSLRNMHCYLSGNSFENLYTIPWVDNTGVTYVECGKNNKIIYQNDLSHLTPEIMPQKRRSTIYYEKE